jgi:hypothetical protein
MDSLAAAISTSQGRTARRDGDCAAVLLRWRNCRDQHGRRTNKQPVTPSSGNACRQPEPVPARFRIVGAFAVPV